MYKTKIFNEYDIVVLMQTEFDLKFFYMHIHLHRRVVHRCVKNKNKTVVQNKYDTLRAIRPLTNYLLFLSNNWCTFSILSLCWASFIYFPPFYLFALFNIIIDCVISNTCMLLFTFLQQINHYWHSLLLLNLVDSVLNKSK